MRLDKILSNLHIRVEPFALCLICDGWRLQLPGPSEVVLHFVLKGKGSIFSQEDGEQRISACSLVIVPPGIPHVLASAGPVHYEKRIEKPPADRAICQLVAGPCEDPNFVVACGIVHVTYGQSLGLFTRLKNVLVADMAGNARVPAAFQAILAEQSHPGPGSEALTASLMNECLVHAFRKLAEGGPLPWLSAIEDDRLGRVLDRIFEDLGGDHTVESLADAAGMSRSTFSECFTEAFGRPPMTFLHQLRMQRAANLLTEASYSVEQVAARIGFSSRSHFSHAFKEHHGVSPALFREQATRG
ncbi:helix-turn-helix domain-containing protein [Petrachloros mirabilis]